MKFVKMQAAGNDYVYLCDDGKNRDYSALSKKLSDRHYGIGGDGIIVLYRGDKTDLKMRIFNADGSEGATCGNGIRCSAHLAVKYFGLRKNKVSIETKAGRAEVSVSISGKYTAVAEADMGKVKTEEIPAAIDENLSKLGLYRVKGDFFCVNVGNRHVVCFTDAPLADIHAAIEADETTRGIYNVERVTEVGGEVKAEVYERGSGKTLSCGSGATAVAYSLLLRDNMVGKRNDAIPDGETLFGAEGATAVAYSLNIKNNASEKPRKIILDGGTLTVRFDGGRAYLSGETEITFTGDVDI